MIEITPLMQENPTLLRANKVADQPVHLISTFAILYMESSQTHSNENLNIVCSWASWFERYFFGNPSHVFMSWHIYLFCQNDKR